MAGQLFVQYLNQLTLRGCIYYSTYLSGSVALLLLELFLPYHFDDRLNYAYVFYVTLFYNTFLWMTIWIRRCVAHLRPDRTISNVATPLWAPQQLGTVLLICMTSWIRDVARLTSLRAFVGHGTLTIGPLSSVVVLSTLIAMWMSQLRLLSVTQTIRLRTRTMWMLAACTLVSWLFNFRVQLEWYDALATLGWLSTEIILDLANRQLEYAVQQAPRPSASCLCSPTPSYTALTVNETTTTTTALAQTSRNDRWIRVWSPSVSTIEMTLYSCISGVLLSGLAIVLFDVDHRETLVGMFDSSTGSAGAVIVLMMIMLRSICELVRIQFNHTVEFLLRPTSDPIWRALLTAFGMYLLAPQPTDVIDALLLFVICLTITAFVCLALIDYGVERSSMVNERNNPQKIKDEESRTTESVSPSRIVLEENDH